MSADTERWFAPSGSRRFHVFDQNLRSLCGRWMLWADPTKHGYAWGDSQGQGSSGDCAACARKLGESKAD